MFQGGYQVHPEIERLRFAEAKMRSAFATWAKFVPVPLVGQLCKTGTEAQLGVTYCEVTVLFCDVAGFEEMCKNSTVADVLHFIRNTLDVLSKALSSSGGTLIKFIGCQILAVFNAPLEVKKHEEKALTAALEAQENMLKTSPSKEVFLIFGLNKASILIGNIGAPQRMNYDVLGDGVNTAARLMSVNYQLGTRCLLSDSLLTNSSCADTFLIRPIGNLVLKGRSHPTRTLEAVALRHGAPAWMADCVHRHTTAWNLYMRREFTAAKALLEVNKSILLKTYGRTDRPTAQLLKSCNEYLASPPDDYWDGSVKLNKK